MLNIKTSSITRALKKCPSEKLKRPNIFERAKSVPTFFLQMYKKLTVTEIYHHKYAAKVNQRCLHSCESDMVTKLL